MITQKIAKSVFKYNHTTGDLVWRKNKDSGKGSRKAGEVAGYIMSNGYMGVCIDGKPMLNHRLIWLISYGYFPEQHIDHIDRNPLNNRIENLRAVSAQCNIRNTGNYRTNTSGVKGVSFFQKKWRAIVVVNNKRKYLGDYEDFDDAACARLAAEQFLDWAGCDSNSPAYVYVKNHINSQVRG